MYIEDAIACLRYSMLLGAPELMGFLVRCAGQEKFLQPNVSISYQQHSVSMQELDVGYSQCTWNRTRRTGRKLATLANDLCWPTGGLRTWMKSCTPEYDSLNVVIMRECSSIWGDRVTLNWCTIKNLQNSIDLDPWEWRRSWKGSYWVCINWGEIWISRCAISARRTYKFWRYSIVLECCS
jgi:hypothetical protein